MNNQHHSIQINRPPDLATKHVQKKMMKIPRLSCEKLGDELIQSFIVISLRESLEDSHRKNRET